MGVLPGSFCNCKCKDQKSNNEVNFPNPNPNNYNIKRIGSFGEYVVVLINYPDCTNYEGNKIMVFENMTQDQLEKMDSIDPHFCDKDHSSPIARFEPTDRGWFMAMNLVETLSKRKLGLVLSDVPRDKLFRKIRVWNAKQTQKGWTTAVFAEDREDITIEITWDDGHISESWHFQCDKIKVIPEESDRF